ncbi:MAG: hypothetical protein J3Q66DRAFT_446011 [Benniella sp.]|nr:MAG: hypothetical protein J3Q66DRAFT_446011 [Benniella sp.]
MLFGNIISSPRDVLTPTQALELANAYLEHASKANDPYIALILCHDTEVSLSQAARGLKRFEVQGVHEGIADAYVSLGRLLDKRGRRNEAQACYKKADKLSERVQRGHSKARHRNCLQDDCQCQCHGLHRREDTQEVGQEQHVQESIQEPDHLSQSQSTQDPDINNNNPPVGIPCDSMSNNEKPYLVPAGEQEQGGDTRKNSQIFAKNIRPPGKVKPPKADERFSTTSQLAACLCLMKHSQLLGDMLDAPARRWLEAIEKDNDEQDRLKILATNVIRAFQREEIKDGKAVAEVVSLAPVLEKSDFQYLLRELCKGIDQSILLDVHQLHGVAQLIHCAEPGYLDAGDLVKILELLSIRLRNTHAQSSNHMYQLTMTVSRVLDAMADTRVGGLDREKLHEPLSLYLSGIQDISDPHLVYQAAYAYQALLYVPDDETLWQATLRRTGKVIQGVAGLVNAVKSLDLNRFMDGLKDIQQGVSGAVHVFKLTKPTIGDASLVDSGKDFVECMKEELGLKRKLTWYPALRGAESLLRSGQHANFKKVVCEAPCRRDPVFQWGLCQLLGEAAADSMWDAKTRQGAVMFLGEIYSDRTVWKSQANVQEWILVILMKLASSCGDDVQAAAASSLIRDLELKADTQGRENIQACRQKDHAMYPLRITSSTTASPSLIDRAQNRPDVEGHLRQLRKQHLMVQGNAVYIPPQAKAGLQASDESRFQLMDKVKEFLNSEQRVFLLLGDPGAGKSTFSRALNRELWSAYKKDGEIPLHINLPAIDKPENDMIAKQLRKMELTEPQIRELKVHRKFILICDGYDESQQTHNLYATNRLNEPGEWAAKMIISCRTEYLGIDYRDRFQPGDRNERSKTTQFQEAVITPFSESQIDVYINEYVSIQHPLWEAKDYKEALDLIPSLKELVKNPFLMTLSLEVMPRMMDPGERISATHITKVGLYDHFIEHWFERGKKRLGEKKLNPQSRAAFEGLIDEGFTRNGIDFLKNLAVAVYKEQGGHPIVEYSRYKDHHSWKSEFFSRDDEKQLLREACPLTRNGNQYRFIHRSLLEYGLALAVFDPQDWRRRATPVPSLERRGSASSVSSFEMHGDAEREIREIERGPDLSSPLAWRSFVNEHSLVKFLEERVQQEPVFKQQLMDYIEYSKVDKKWRTAAANAITILVRAGIQFISTDLQGIRIPGADLSYGVFDAVNLQGADLRKVNLSNAWFLGSDLSRAQMKDVQFGELPFLKFDREVKTCIYSPDGTSFAVVLSDGSINVYGTSNWERSQILSGHSRSITGIAYSPNGERIISGSRDSGVRVWDVATGDCLYIFIGHASKVYDVAYSPQGLVIALRSWYGTVRLWDLESGDCRSIISGCGFSTGMAFSPKGDTIAIGCDDCRVRLWDIASGEFRRILIGHTHNVTNIAYSAQGDLLISKDSRYVVRIWKAETGTCRLIMQGGEYAVLSPKGNQIAFYKRAGLFRDLGVALWDVETGVCVRKLSGFKREVDKVVYSPQGDHIVTGGNGDDAVRLWDVETGECRQMMTGHTEQVTKVLYSPKGDYIASASDDNTVRLWNVGSGSSRNTSIGHRRAVLGLQYSSKRNEVASCSRDSTIRLWDAETGVCSRTLTGHRSSVNAISYSPQQDCLASCSDDCKVRLWDAETGACLRILSGHTEAVLDVAFSPQGNHIASAGYGLRVRLWNAETGKCQHTLKGNSRRVMFVAYSPLGSQVASVDFYGTVRLWDVETGVCQHTLRGHYDDVNQINYSPNGNQIASASSDNTVRLWDVKMGVCSHILRGHRSNVTRVVYSPRGDQVASASTFDQTVRLWDTESGKSHHILIGHKEGIDTIAYSPRGNLIASWSDSGEGRLWDVATGDCVWNLERDRLTEYDGCLWSHPFVWMSSDVDSFITGYESGSVRRWDVIKAGDRYHVRMRWRSTNGQLGLKGACVQDVQGLSDINKRLLKQRGATGEPTVRLRETSKKVMTMASVVSKLKSPASNTEGSDSLSTSLAISFTEHSEQPSEQAMGAETLES